MSVRVSMCEITQSRVAWFSPQNSGTLGQSNSININVYYNDIFSGLPVVSRSPAFQKPPLVSSSRIYVVISSSVCSIYAIYAYYLQRRCLLYHFQPYVGCSQPCGDKERGMVGTTHSWAQVTTSIPDYPDTTGFQNIINTFSLDMVDRLSRFHCIYKSSKLYMLDPYAYFRLQNLLSYPEHETIRQSGPGKYVFLFWFLRRIHLV